MIVHARLLIASAVVVMGAWLLGDLWWYDQISTWTSFVLRVLVPVVVLLGFLPLSSWARKRSALVAALDVRDGAFVLTPSVVASFRDRPRIELRPNGLGLFDRINTHVVPWHAITVGPYPWVNPSTSGRAVNRISVAQPDQLRRGGLARLRPKARNVSLPPLVTTHPAFVAAAINHYLFHPQHRDAIGTPQEYIRLCQTLAGTRSELGRVW